MLAPFMSALLLAADWCQAGKGMAQYGWWPRGPGLGCGEGQDGRAAAGAAGEGALLVVTVALCRLGVGGMVGAVVEAGARVAMEAASSVCDAGAGEGGGHVGAGCGLGDGVAPRRREAWSCMWEARRWLRLVRQGLCVVASGACYIGSVAVQI